jgi:ABC-2 type transport system ATP-binding protein
MQALVLESVSKAFYPRPGLFDRRWGRSKPATIHAVRQVSLTVPRGDVLVLLGPNGSGKSTLLKLIATMLLPDEGRVEIEGTDAVRHPERAVSKVALAITAERSFFPRLTARENLEFYATLDEVPAAVRSRRVEEVLETTGIASVAERLVQSFSAGMYQRLGIARALLKRPALLLLDEPSNSLDPETAADFWAWVRESARAGTTAVLATHNFEEAVNVGTRVAVLRQGVVAGSHEIDSNTNVEELRRYYHLHTQQAAGFAALPWKAHAASV